MTTGEAAKAVGVSLSTLTRWAHAGQVTAAYVTPGGHFRWDVPDLRRQLGMPAADSDRADASPSDRNS